MAIKIKMIPMKPRGEGSLLYVDEQLYKPQESEKGLCGIIGVMFTRLIYKQDSCINHIIAHSRLSSELPTKISDLALIDPFYYNDRHGNHLGKELSVNVLQNIRMVIGLITWLRSEHFKRDEIIRSQTCIVCGNIQRGRQTGQFTGGVHLGPGPGSGGEERIEYPKLCTNPNCLSHEIEKMINPEYKIPEESLKEEGEQSEFEKVLQEIADNNRER
jgi:hypothetical protein